MFFFTYNGRTTRLALLKLDLKYMNEFPVKYGGNILREGVGVQN